MPRPERKIALLPATLRARLTVTIVAASVLIFIIVYGVATLATAAQGRAVASQSAVEDLNGIRYRISLEARYLDSYLAGFTDWQEFYDKTLAPDPVFTQEELDPWLRDRSGATVVVWADADGSTIFRYGSSDDAALITQLALADADGILSGPIRLPSGSAVLAVRPVRGNSANARSGFLAIAKPMTPEMITSADVFKAENTSVLAAVPAHTEPWTELPTTEGYSAAAADIGGRRVDVVATLSGIDGRLAAVIAFNSADKWYDSSSAILRYALPLGLGLLSLLLGLGLGLVLGKLIRRPIKEFVAFMRNEGYMAIEGLPFHTNLTNDPALPVEFQELSDVTEQLLEQLRDRQAELKRANEQTMAAETAFRTVVNDSSEVKLLIRDGVVDIANPAAAACFGKALGFVVKHPLESLLEPMTITTEAHQRISPAMLIEAALGGSTLVQCESPDHEPRWMRVSVSESDAPNTYLFSARNVTEEHRLEALRAEIVSLVSHDLRAPLTVITGYLELLSRPLDQPTRERAYEAARTAAGRMSTLLGELLDTTRAEQVFAPSVFRRVRLGILADEVAEAMRMATGQRITVVKQQRAIVLGDDLRIRQAVENLVGNALKHTPENTDVRIIIDVHGDRGVICVEDHGPGIPECDREAVFERFARLNQGEGAQGFGLGLYIVRVIAESHGGAVHAESAESGGARLVLELPLAPRTGQKSEDAPQESDEEPSA